jgi:NodT family efflux transporter outer membrane factor (OMF) lipoprotein
MKTTLTLIAALLLAGCAIGPEYRQPEMATPTAFKEAEGWVAARPADAIERDHWWAGFGDPALDQLAARVAVSNQNVAAAVAAYAQARALVGERRAALLPAVNLIGSANRTNFTNVVTPGQRLRFDLGATWEADVWGRLRRAAGGAEAGAQASAGDLATATLSAQGELVTNYLLLRQADAQRRLLASAIDDYQRVVTIAENRYRAGVAAKTDLLQAQTQLANARSEYAGLESQRAQLEHAIAVLVGEAPANFSLAPHADWQPTVPGVPAVIPSELLQRRPDIAAAERRMAAANAQIGIARAAYYPSIGLSAGTGAFGRTGADLLSAPTTLWSIGVSLTQSVFNAGLVKSRVRGAEAMYEQEVAAYRQTVLSAFQQVEDQLVATRVLAEQEQQLAAAAEAAAQAQQQVLNRYRAGQVSFLEVAVAQTTALTAQRALLQMQSNRQVAGVALIQAIGGGWSGEGQRRE